MKTQVYSLIVFLVVSAFSRCKAGEIIRPASRGELVEISKNGSLTKSEIEERITEFDAQNWAEYDVTYYSITYRTEYMGKPMDSKGLLIVPNGIDTVDLLMYCHGTEIPSEALGVKNVTPSLYSGSMDTHNDVRNMGLGWASKGYVVFIPDYIGFGLTLGTDHPYVYYPELFISNIDGLLAVKKHFSDQGYYYDNQLFITGWSQGGGACLSAHRYIQEQYASEFSVEASSGLAGLLNFQRVLEDNLTLSDEESQIMPIVSWAVYTVNKFSELKRPTDQIYLFPVYNQMSSIFVPSKKPNEVFVPDFIKKILNGEDTQFRDVMARNSFTAGWLPVGKVFLHHGDADNVVPYYCSTEAQTGLKAMGGNVTLHTYSGGTHNSELGNFIQITYNDFEPLR